MKNKILALAVLSGLAMPGLAHQIEMTCTEVINDALHVYTFLKDGKCYTLEKVIKGPADNERSPTTVVFNASCRQWDGNYDCFKYRNAIDIFDANVAFYLRKNPIGTRYILSTEETAKETRTGSTKTIPKVISNNLNCVR